MTSTRIALGALALVLSSGFASAQQGEDDLVFRVLRDEVDRSVRRLRLENRESPYYLEYTVRETEQLEVTASFGAISSRGKSRMRNLSVDLRVGDRTLDNSNFSRGGFDFGSLMGMGGGERGRSITVDDDYDALRHEVWLRTDAAYKKAIEDLEAKKAYLQQNTVKDRPDDLSEETPVVSISPTVKLEVDAERWAAAVRKLSAIFRDYPRVQTSMVSFNAVARNRWLVNSEGFRTRSGRPACGLIVMASAQADDGMKLSDVEAFPGRAEGDLPKLEDLEKRVRALAERLTALAAAPPAEDYRGPILFEGPAAAEFFAQTLVPQLGNAHETVGGSGRTAALGNQLREKIGQKVLPPFLSVVDDPLAREHEGVALHGGWDVDDDGVKAQKITLVEKGVLKTFCMGRIPARQVKKSNGHSRNGTGAASIVFIQSDSKLGAKELREKLAELGKDEDLKEVLVARRVSNVASAALNPHSMISSVMSRMSGGGGGGVSLLPPVLLYRVSLEDGKETLVRGAQFSHLTLRTLRDIEATGDDARPYPTLRAGDQIAHLVTPSILLKEIEVQKPAPDTEKPPVLLNPYFEK